MENSQSETQPVVPTISTESSTPTQPTPTATPVATPEAVPVATPAQPESHLGPLGFIKRLFGG